MSTPGTPAALVGHIALLAIISFGGVPGVLPDLRDFVVDANGFTGLMAGSFVFTATLTHSLDSLVAQALSSTDAGRCSAVRCWCQPVK